MQELNSQTARKMKKNNESLGVTVFMKKAAGKAAFFVYVYH
jgi:hypothetical protein